MRSRRQFLIGSGWGVAVLASDVLTRAVGADALGKHPGIQLYTINEAMRADPGGSLKRGSLAQEANSQPGLRAPKWSTGVSSDVSSAPNWAAP